MSDLSIVAYVEGRLPVITSREALSERQREVLYLTSTGMKTGEIAAELGVCTQTIKSTRNDIINKIGKASYIHSVYRNG